MIFPHVRQKDEATRWDLLFLHRLCEVANMLSSPTETNHCRANSWSMDKMELSRCHPWRPQHQPRDHSSMLYNIIIKSSHNSDSPLRSQITAFLHLFMGPVSLPTRWKVVPGYSKRQSPNRPEACHGSYSNLVTPVPSLKLPENEVHCVLQSMMEMADSRVSGFNSDTWLIHTQFIDDQEHQLQLELPLLALRLRIRRWSRSTTFEEPPGMEHVRNLC